MGRSREALIRWSGVLARLLAGGLFIYAGWLKARDPGAFVRDVWNYRLVPESAAYWIAAYVPYLEITAGAALVTGLQRRGAALVIASLLVVFIVFLSSAWARGLDISCGCFGSASAASADYPWLVARNGLLLGAVAWGAASARLLRPR